MLTCKQARLTEFSGWIKVTGYSHLILHMAHSGLDQAKTSLHREHHEGAGHHPGRVVILKFQP